MIIETALTETEAAAKADIFEILSHAPGEVRGVQEALREGRINGSFYIGECCCLIGTIAKLQHRDIRETFPTVLHNYSPAEKWFMPILPGKNPRNSKRARITDEWLTEWLTMYGETNNDG